MTVAAATRKAGPFTGDGVNVSFPFTFKVFQTSDVLVVLTDLNGNETTETLTSQYTVALNSNQDSSPGGTVTMLSAPASGYLITIGSQVPQSQVTTLTNTGGFFPTVINDMLDRVTILVQQLSEQLGRSLKTSISTPAGVSTTLPSPSANKVIGWNASADALQNLDAGSLATIVAFGTANADIFTGDGVTKIFTLSANPGAQANLDVSLGGVTQLPGVDYTWSGGTQVTFGTAPPNLAKLLIRYFQGLPQGYTDSSASTYTPSGAGAVATAVQTKLRESVSVKDFGAKGDGVTDDTAAVQAAINYCKANGARLRLNGGTYRMTSLVSIGTSGSGAYGGFDVEGDGPSCTTLLLDFNASIGVDLNPGTGGYTAYARCQFGGFKVAVNAGKTVNNPLRVINAYDNRFHDIHIYVPFASINSSFVGLRVSGACYFNQFENIWVESSADATVGSAASIGDGKSDIGLSGAATNVNTFINCRTRGFGVGWGTLAANATSFIGCDAEVCGVGFRNLSCNGSTYINCWAEGCTTEMSIDRGTVHDAAGTPSTGSGCDYTIVEGGFWGTIAIDYAYRTRLKARYNTLSITANTEFLESDALNESATHTGAGNDALIKKRLNSPSAINVLSLGSKPYGFEFPNTTDVGKILWASSGDDVYSSSYRSNGAGSYKGYKQTTDGNGSWVLDQWTTAAAIGSETPVKLITANTSGVFYSVGLMPLTDNVTKLGDAANRWSTVYAGTGAINTSDARQKQQIREISDVERLVAVRIKGLLRAFKFNDAVEQKSDKARIHFGVIAQDVKAAFEAEGLVAEDYGVLCYDEWGEQPETKDEEGNVAQPYFAAGNRYGVRYEELLAFIISAL